MQYEREEQGIVVAMQIEVGVMSAITHYLQDRPFKEVAHLLGALQQARPVTVQPQPQPPLPDAK